MSNIARKGTVQELWCLGQSLIMAADGVLSLPVISTYILRGFRKNHSNEIDIIRKTDKTGEIGHTYPVFPKMQLVSLTGSLWTKGTFKIVRNIPVTTRLLTSLKKRKTTTVKCLP